MTPKASAMRKSIIVGVLGLLATAALAARQEPPSQPTSRAAPPTAERLGDLVTLIEGSNPPEVRRKVARELLLQNWPETPPRLVVILGAPNAAAKVAVASALSELPQFLDSTYIEPLMGMLGDAEPEVRASAARALAAYDGARVVARLRKQAGDPDVPARARLGAIATLGLMTERDALDSLAELLADPDATVAAAALTALQQAAAIDFGDDATAARRWWEESRTLPLEEWQALQIRRLVQKDRESRERLDALEGRLVKALEGTFQKSPDSERITLLAAYLADSSVTVRLLGLRLAQMHLSEGKAAESLPPELLARIRDMLQSTQPREQAAAVRTIAALRRPEDGETFVNMLAAARNRTVRLALINSLGYVGDGTATEALLAVLNEADDEMATEVVAALGRLADRDALRDEHRRAVVGAVRKIFDATKPGQVVLRERALWAMGNIADASFAPAFVTALDPAEAVAVRQAAARGVAALNDPKLADALAAAVNDPDVGVRKTVIETLASIGTADKHLQALWGRLTSPPEPDETLRQLAWRGALKLLSKRPGAQIEEWIARLPGEGPQQRQRRLELLQSLLRTTEQAKPPDRARTGAVRARIAAQYALLEQADEALAEYAKARAELQGTDSEAAQRVAVEMLRYALVSGRYTQTTAEALAGSADCTALWQAARQEIEPRLMGEKVDQALVMLKALRDYPPCKWPAAIEQDIEQTVARAQALKEAAKSGAESRPGTASRPGADSRPGANTTGAPPG
jgi:HEAT repeat protein